MWCTQNGSLPKSWFSAERVNALLRASTESVRGSTPQSWDAHIEFLQSTAGADYNRLLSEQFEAIRKGPKESPTALANA